MVTFINISWQFFLCWIQNVHFSSVLSGSSFLIESEKKLDFIGALICNIKVRLNSAANFVIHWKTWWFTSLNQITFIASFDRFDKVSKYIWCLNGSFTRTSVMLWLLNTPKLRNYWFCNIHYPLCHWSISVERIGIDLISTLQEGDQYYYLFNEGRLINVRNDQCLGLDQCLVFKKMQKEIVEKNTYDCELNQNVWKG